MNLVLTFYDINTNLILRGDHNMSSIVHISEMVSIALHSMVVLAYNKDKGLLNVKEIANLTGASEAHLSKVMQRLVKANYIQSVRGPKGGFSLIKPPESITLLEIYEVIDGPIVIAECPTNCKNCSFKTCIFGGIPQKINDIFREYLLHKKISDFIGIIK